MQRVRGLHPGKYERLMVAGSGFEFDHRNMSVLYAARLMAERCGELKGTTIARRIRLLVQHF